jgi:hypothetical protein
MQVIEEFMDAKAASRTRQQLPHQPAERLHIRDVMTLHHVPEDDRVDITLKQAQPIPRVQPLGFGKPSRFKVGDE